MSNEIVVRGLQKELADATKKISTAMWEVGHRLTEGSHGKERQRADEGIRKLKAACKYYDRVKDELELAEAARIDAFNTANNAS
jgi:hypothetical protein